MINKIVLVSGVQQSDSVIHIRVTILFQIPFPFRLLQSIVLYSRSTCTRWAREKEGRKERKNKRGGGMEEGREKEQKERKGEKEGREGDREGEKNIRMCQIGGNLFFFFQFY